MPTYVHMTRCDGCGQCVDICPSDIMHIDTDIRRAYNIEPDMCWECYSCVKACPHNAISVRGYADFIPQLADETAPADSMRDSQLLFNEPKYVRFDEGGLHTLESNKLVMKEGVYY